MSLLVACGQRKPSEPWAGWRVCIQHHQEITAVWVLLRGSNTRKPLDFCSRANHHRQKEQRTSVLASALPHLLPAWPSHQMAGRRKAVFQLASRAEMNFCVTAELCFPVFQQRTRCQGVTRSHPVLTQSSRGCSIPSSGWSHPVLDSSQQQVM